MFMPQCGKQRRAAQNYPAGAVDFVNSGRRDGHERRKAAAIDRISCSRQSLPTASLHPLSVEYRDSDLLLGTKLLLYGAQETSDGW